MQRVRIFQIMRHMKLLGPPCFCLFLPLFCNFLQVSMVKRQKYDSVANSGTEPRLFKVSEVSSYLGPMRKQTKTCGTLPKLNTDLICEFLLCYFIENYKKEGKTGKSGVSGKQLLGIRNLKYKFLSS